MLADVLMASHVPIIVGDALQHSKGWNGTKLPTYMGR